MWEGLLQLEASERRRSPIWRRERARSPGDCQEKFHGVTRLSGALTAPQLDELQSDRNQTHDCRLCNAL